MIPAKNAMTQVGELPGEEIKFSIGDPRWVMRTQADLYSNRELAVVREYSTNAFDANKQKAMDEGVEPQAIEVTLPSLMNPYFKVRDHGYGMTRDILADVYTKFGESTKRDSNHFNGMLGYGSKSAVAYTTQFTVTSVSEGIKTVAVVTRKPDWDIVMKIVSQSKTDEPSGTEITVPVHNAQEFAQKANDFYKFWLPGTVLVNERVPAHDVGEKIAEGFYHSNTFGVSYIVMGNVPYRIENARALFWGTGIQEISFVAYVDTGDVEFTPSREALKYTDLTKETLHKVITDFAEQIKQKAQADIDKASTHREAYEAWDHWTSVLGKGLLGDLTFKGDKFESVFKVNAYRYRHGQRYGTRKLQSMNVTSPNGALVITEFNGQPSSPQKAKAKQYADHIGLNSTTFYFIEGKAEDIASPWIEKSGKNWITWEELKAKVPKPQKSVASGYKLKNNKGSFDVMVYGGATAYDAYVPDEGHVFYATIQDAKSHNLSQIIANLDDKDVKVVLVGANRLAKFRRDYPEIPEFLSYAKSQVVVNTETLLSQDQKDLMSIEYSDKRWLSRIDPDKVDDPEVQRYARLVKNGVSGTDKYNNNKWLAHYTGVQVKDYKAKERSFLIRNYPLLEHLGYSFIRATSDEIYIYLNAKYASRKDKK